MKEIKAEIEIEASAVRVWDVLTDFEAYPEWNPFLRKISGDTKAGGKLRVFIQPPGSRGFAFRPRLLDFETRSKIRWFGHLFVPGLVDGEHTLAIEEIEGGRVRFRQQEKFTGLFLPLLSRTLAATSQGFEAMNRALKERAESS